jgi:hypothetical protein
MGQNSTRFEYIVPSINTIQVPIKKKTGMCLMWSA